jgi:hypothetical protein
VLFSAAIPYQGGTGHVNERWPDYWAALFERHGYVVVDAIRKRVWRDRQVASWYAQNILVYVRPEVLPRFPALAAAAAATDRGQLSLVHPRRYLYMTDPAHLPLGRVLRALPALVTNALGRRLRRLPGTAEPWRAPRRAATAPDAAPSLPGADAGGTPGVVAVRATAHEDAPHRPAFDTPPKP